MRLKKNRTDHILNAISVTLLLIHFGLSVTGVLSGVAYRSSEWMLGACAVLVFAGCLLIVGFIRFAGILMFLGGLMGFPLGITSIIAGLRILRSKPIPVQRESHDCCKRCGYSLHGLSLPRCPECGCLCGFDVPLESLGLTEDDLNSCARMHGGPSFTKAKGGELP